MVWHKEIMGELWMRLNETVVVIVVVVVVVTSFQVHGNVRTNQLSRYICTLQDFQAHSALSFIKTL